MTLLTQFPPSLVRKLLWFQRCGRSHHEALTQCPPACPSCHNDRKATGRKAFHLSWRGFPRGMCRPKCVGRQIEVSGNTKGIPPARWLGGASWLLSDWCKNPRACYTNNFAVKIRVYENSWMLSFQCYHVIIRNFSRTLQHLYMISLLYQTFIKS